MSSYLWLCFCHFFLISGLDLLNNESIITEAYFISKLYLKTSNSIQSALSLEMVTISAVHGAPTVPSV